MNDGGDLNDGRNSRSTMAERFLLYIDILGFKHLVRSGVDLVEVYNRIDRMNAHADKDFTCIVFSETVLACGSDGWVKHPSMALM
jgi:hypothetical protein